MTFTTKALGSAIRVPESVQGPPYVLDRAGAVYLLTEDVAADGTAFDIRADNVTLDLDGHKVVYGLRSEEASHGVVASRPRAGRIGPLRLNLGAPGDRRDDRDGLWLAIPRPYERRPHWFPKAFDPGEVIQVRGGVAYRRHSDLIDVRSTDVPWVLASGISGAATISVDVSRMPGESRCTVRLHFAELEERIAGKRIFDVKLAGKEVLHGFDVVATAGGPRAAVVKEYVVQAKERLTVELIPVRGEPILSGVEILPSSSVSADPLTASSRR